MTSDITVFLSGTRKDLAGFYPDAKAAIEKLPGYRVSMMEDVEPEDIPGDHWSRREAARPDVVVGLVGHYYGATSKSTGRSMTEEEFLAAGDMGIDRLMFLTDVGDKALIDGQTDLAKEQVKAFRATIDADVVRGSIQTPEEFADAAVAALQAWEEQTFRGALAGAEVYFDRLLRPERLYGHQQPFIGQRTALAVLEGFVSSAQRILVLQGPWGRGKTRLLLEFGRKHPKQVRFLRDDAEPRRQLLGVSPRDPRVIVVEDAHKRSPEDIRLLVAQAQRWGSEVKLIFVTRPDQRASIDAAVLEYGLAADECQDLTLPALTDREQGELIEQIAGRSGPETAALVLRTRGNVLAAITAARLLHDSRLSLAEIENNPDFEHVVLKRFKTELIAVIDQNPRFQRIMERVLEAVALAGPVRPSNDRQADTLAEFVGSTRDEVIRAITVLEKHGLLLRRGGLVRVAVDAIAESVVFDACVGEHVQKTGLADRAFTELWPIFGKNVLRNLALAEWEGLRSGTHVRLLDTIWPILKAIYGELDRVQRLDFLKHIEEVAGLQPKEALEFVRDALPLGMGPAREGPFPDSMKQEYLNDGFADILRHVLYVPSLLPESLNLLSQLTADDLRGPETFTSSPERILRDACELRYGRPVAYYEAIVDWAERRLQEEPVIPGDRLAIYLSSLLDKEVELSWAEGDTFHLSSRPVARERIAPLRARVLELLRTICTEQLGKSRREALKAIIHALRRPDGRGREVLPEEEGGWLPEDLAVVQLLRDLNTELNDPLSSLSLRTELWSFSKFGKDGPLKEAVRDFVVVLDAGLEGSLEIALTPAHRLDLDLSMFSQHEKRIDEVARQMLDEPSAETALEKIVKTHSALTQAGLESRPERLLYTLGRLKPSWGVEFLNLYDADHPLAHTSHAVVEGVLAGGDEAEKAAVDAFFRTGPPRALRTIASNLRFRPVADAIGPEAVLAHLQQFLRHEDKGVRLEALTGVAIAEHLNARARADLLLSYDLADFPESTDDWAMAFHDQAVYESLSIDEKRSIAMQLRHTPRLGSYAGLVIEKLCRDVPESVVELLSERIMVAATRGDRYEAIDDFGAHRPFESLAEVDREKALVRLGDFVGNDEFRMNQPARSLFDELSEGHHETASRVVLNWINVGSPEDLKRAAAAIGGCGRDHLPEFGNEIVALLEKARVHGRDFAIDLTRTMAAGKMVETSTRVPGQPNEREVLIRDWAREAVKRNSGVAIVKECLEMILRGAEERIAVELQRDEEDSLQ